MPTPRQMERKAPAERGLAPDDDLPAEYWQVLLDDLTPAGSRAQAPPDARSA